jgi:hypothetical protein
MVFYFLFSFEEWAFFFFSFLYFASVGGAVITEIRSAFCSFSFPVISVLYSSYLIPKPNQTIPVSSLLRRYAAQLFLVHFQG